MKRFSIGATALLMMAGAALAQATSGTGEGEVRKIDASAGKMTVRHGPLEGLEMPAMTMVFRVEDQSVLQKLKEGDRIRFVAVREGGALLLRSVEKVE